MSSNTYRLIQNKILFLGRPYALAWIETCSQHALDCVQSATLLDYARLIGG